MARTAAAVAASITVRVCAIFRTAMAALSNSCFYPSVSPWLTLLHRVLLAMARRHSVRVTSLEG